MSGETGPGAWPGAPGPGLAFTCLNILAEEQRPLDCWQGGQEKKSPSGMWLEGEVSGGETGRSL